jgi:hypothetical protein
MQFTHFDHYVEIDQDLLNQLSLSYSQEQGEEGGGGQEDSLYDVVLTESSQLEPRDLDRYIKLCQEGRFYDELMSLDDNQTDRKPSRSRSSPRCSTARTAMKAD